MGNMNDTHNGNPHNNISGESTVVYFSMEIGLDPEMPTYGGGLGILAGDTLKAAADLGLPMVGITLLHRKGYLFQHLDSWGNQSESDNTWYPEEHLEALPQRVSLDVQGRQVLVRAWRHLIVGAQGHTVPVYFLDTELYENRDEDRRITDYLYGGDARYRLKQEAVLGLGGVGMLRALGYHNVQTYHMNEGHSAFLALALLQEWCCHRGFYTFDHEGVAAVRRQCVFTTHTPVAAGHDEFPMELVREVLGDLRASLLSITDGCRDGRLSMSHLALTFSDYVNGVSQRHGEISRLLYPNHTVDSITNGVHGATWVAPSFAQLYDRYAPDWRRDNATLAQATNIPLEEIIQAHREARLRLLEEILRRTGIDLDPNALTIGFARRAAVYKRADFLFSDLDRVKRIAKEAGPFQVLYAGKAHANDGHSKEIIRRVFQAANALRDTVRVFYLENYDMALAKLLCAGVDLWLNNPQKPLEASGTSGMKAALNGVPSLSVLDGWWVEGHREGVTGWSIGDSATELQNPIVEARVLYSKLEHVILPMFYQRPHEYAEVMRSAIAVNGSYFNTHRMITQYAQRAYHLDIGKAASAPLSAR
jgi:starch phosphorylase